MRKRGIQRFHAAKVATVATAIVVAVAIVLAVVLNLVVAHRMEAEVDHRLSERLVDAVKPDFGVGIPPGGMGPGGMGPVSSLQQDGDFKEVPSFVWHVNEARAVTPLTMDAPSLPELRWDTTPITHPVAGSMFRFDAVRSGSGWLVAGESVNQIDRINSELLIAEGLLGTLLIIVTFAGSLIVGLRASAPIEQIRRRQSEFTADASHELRTPLSVIEAEVELALSRPRDVEGYQDTLQRVSAESARLRSIVNDLLWLARADNEESDNDVSATVDVAVVAESSVQRFAAVAEAHSIDLSFRHSDSGSCIVRLQPDSIERLIGVLLDNACRHAGTGGTVVIGVGHTDNRVTLTVDDSGPGIPEDHLPFVFDRFHRATELPGGTGLGLAIADAVVRHTNGTWSIGRGPLGGAHMGVTWRQALHRQPEVRTVNMDAVDVDAQVPPSHTG